MNVWLRSGVPLISFGVIGLAAIISRERPERCAYVLRQILDSARRTDRDGAFAIDTYDIAFTVSCGPASIEEIVATFARPEVGLIGALGPQGDEGLTTGVVARWREWTVDRTLSAVFD